MDKISNKWFFAYPGVLLHWLQIYVKGDMLLIFPIWIIIIGIAFISWKFALVLSGIFLTLRGIGEMIYWLLQQFGKQEYRPYTPFKNLSNNAVYILYQLSGLFNAFIGLALIAFVFMFLK